MIADVVPREAAATSWNVVQLRRATVNHDSVRIPLNAEERAERGGCVPYWGANSVVDHVDSPLISGPTVLIGEDGAPFFDRLKSVAFALDEPIWPNNHVHVLRPRRGWDPRFIAYALNTVDYSLYIKGSTRDKLNQSELSSIVIPAPDHQTQVRIAEFLDYETGAIDAFIADQERLIDLLTERLEAELRSVVRPDHAVRQLPIGRLVERRLQPAHPDHETVTAYRDGEVTTRSQRREDGYTFSAKNDGYQAVTKGDIVVHGLDAFAGAVGVSNANGVCSPVYHVLKAKPGTDAEYLAIALRAYGLTGYLTANAPSVRQRSVDYRNWATFKRLEVPVPNEPEQRHRAERYDASKSRVRAAIADAREAIALSKERRAALISAAVTGKIDVRDWKRSTDNAVAN